MENMSIENLLKMRARYSLLGAKDLLKQLKTSTLSNPQNAGEKGYLPTGDQSEKDNLEFMLNEDKEFLLEQRVVRCGDVQQAEWNASTKTAVVENPKGKFMEHVGERFSNKIVLYPEEILYLMEISYLELIYDEMPVSIEEAYTLLLEDDFTIERCQVYSHLSRMGYIVVRHPESLPSENEFTDTTTSDEENESQNKTSLSNSESVEAVIDKNVEMEKEIDISESVQKIPAKNCKSTNRKYDSENSNNKHICIWKGIDIPNIAGKNILYLERPPLSLFPKNVFPNKTAYTIDVYGMKQGSYYNNYSRKRYDSHRNFQSKKLYDNTKYRSSTSNGEKIDNSETNSTSSYSKNVGSKKAYYSDRGKESSYYSDKQGDNSVHYSDNWKNSGICDNSSFKGLAEPTNEVNMDNEPADSHQNYSDHQVENNETNHLATDYNVRKAFNSNQKNHKRYSGETNNNFKSNNHRYSGRQHMHHKPSNTYNKRRRYNERTFLEYPSAFPQLSKPVNNWKEYKHELKRQVTVEDLKKEGTSTILWKGSICPLVVPSESLTIDKVFTSLSVFEDNDISDHINQFSNDDEIDFDVYLPNTTYSRRNPAPPSHRIKVVRATERVPTFQELQSLKSTLNDDIPLHYGVVDNGLISFYSFNNVTLPSYAPKES